MLSNKRVAIVGAGGKMGSRVRRNLSKLNDRLILIEASPERAKEIREAGYDVHADYNGIGDADLTILAVPDRLVGAISAEVVPLMKTDSCLVLLDPAAAHGSRLTKREDCTFVVTHPCHPPLFGEPEDMEKPDWFGGVSAKQDIVIALESGSEERFAEAQELCEAMFAPVMKVHRISVRDMAILEPAAAEVVVAAAATLMRQALDEAVERGVPFEAARSFLLGHVRIPLAIVFGMTDFPFSDAAQVAIQIGFDKVIRPNWRDVYNEEMLQYEINQMLKDKT